MLARAKVKPTPESDLYPALAEWQQVSQQRRDILTDIKALEAPVALLGLSEREREDPRYSVLHCRAGGYLHRNGTIPSLDRLNRKLAEQKEALDDLMPRFRELAEARERDEKRRIRARAVELQPQHRQAVRDIAHALEQLEKALREEEAVRIEAGVTTGGWRPFDLLPDFGFPNVGRAADPTSAISRWFAAVRAMEILS